MKSNERHEARFKRRKAKREAKRNAALQRYGRFEDAVSLNALAKAAKQAARGVRYKASVKRFMQRELVNVAILNNKLENCRDVHKGFVCFTVVERGKLRQIMSVHYSERVVHKALNQNALIPVMMRPLIHDNSASRTGKGTSFAINRLVAHLRRFYRRYGNQGYVLQADIKNYFGSIDHETAKEQVRRFFDDERIVNLTCRFIDSYYEHYRKEAVRDGRNPDEAKARGLGLGSEINQTLAVTYLDPLDHYIKEVLKVKYYARYNDDFYLIHADKEYLKRCNLQIKAKCDELKITVNERKTHITKLSHGFTFLKTQVFLTDTGKVIRKPCREAVTRERRKLKKQKRLVDSGQMSFEDVRRSYVSWEGSMERKNARRSIRNTEGLFNRLFIDDWLQSRTGGI